MTRDRYHLENGQWRTVAPSICLKRALWPTIGAVLYLLMFIADGHKINSMALPSILMMVSWSLNWWPKYWQFQRATITNNATPLLTEEVMPWPPAKKALWFVGACVLLAISIPVLSQDIAHWITQR